MEPLDPALFAPHSLALSWWKRLSTRDPGPDHFAISRAAIGREEEDDSDVHLLASELARCVPKAIAALQWAAATQEEITKPAKEKGMLLWDARAALFLEGLGGEAAKKAAEGVRKKSRERWLVFEKEKSPSALLELWSLWADTSEEVTPLRFALTLAKVLWLDSVQPQQEHARRKHQALVRPVLEEIGRIYHAKGRTVRDTEDGPKIFDKAGRELATYKPPYPVISLKGFEAAQRRVELLRSLTGHKALRHQITEGHRRVMQGLYDPRRIEFKGGWEAYAKELGLIGRKAVEELADVVRAEAYTQFSWPTGQMGNMLALLETTGYGHQQANVVIVLSDLILPDYYRALPKDGTRLRQEQRQLIPIPPQLPPMIGRTNDYAAQAAFQLQVLGALRTRAEELAEDGAAHLSWSELEELAERAELPERMLREVLERWTQGNDAFLFMPQSECYTLAKGYQGALDFLVQGGQKIIEGRESGLKSAQKAKSTKKNPKKPRR